MKTSTAYIVTGPRGEKKVPSAGVGLSLAISRAEREPNEASYYVHAPDGTVVARADRDAQGIVYGWRLT